ncbi:MAG: L-lysine 6-transaminase, partial [Rhodothermia bacterium]|nr:L-lysine 6-transaminase [Rhodothermia bacterium]
MEVISRSTVTADGVRSVLSRHMLTDGLKMVLDMEKSRGVHLYDAADGSSFIDFFGFFASNALGMNHPALVEDEDFIKRLTEAALNKVTNSDVYTV